LINDEKEFGITVHYVDDGIDTGDIILQGTYPITDADDYHTLLEVAYEECPKLLYQAIHQIQKGEASRTPQCMIAKHGLYCGMRGVGDERLDWNQSSREVFNFVRSICKPGPMAQCTCKEHTIAVNKVDFNPQYPHYKGTPGQVLAIVDGCPLVKTADSYCKILEYESDYKLRVGDRLLNVNISKTWVK
jgi:methionyl-tRNA formyltransferase